MDLREEMERMLREACEANPGLEGFRKGKKLLLWGMMGLFALSKLCAAIPMWRLGHPGAVVFGAVVGMVIPGIFALAVWRGDWRFAFSLLLPAANLAVDLAANGLPALFSGESYYLLFYCIVGLELVMVAYLTAAVLWLTVPRRNRELSVILNGLNEELIRRGKELSGR